MKKMIFTSLFTLILIFSLTTLTDVHQSQSALASSNSFQDKLEIFQLILDTIQQRYVDEYSKDELLEYAINGMLSKLDPHTSYLPVDNFKRWNKNFEGFQGLGIQYIFIDNAPTITGFISGSPAKEAGANTGDRIIEIDDLDAKNLSRLELAEIINNSPHPVLTMKVWRPSANEMRTFKIRRTHLNLKSVQTKTMLQNAVGYIHIDRLCSNTVYELDAAMELLSRQGMRSLVIDLRDNGGGYLSSAVEVADRFLPPGKLIVYTMGKDPASYQEYVSSRSSMFSEIPLTILINHGTASAAEIVAGALQDWDRALIVGETSFGKGLVQSQYRFRDGSALLVTTAKYYTPLGRLIQRNYYDCTKDEYYYDAYDEESHRPELQAQNGETFVTPRGRKVFGGGGIAPDVWMKNNASIVSDELLDLYLNHNEEVLKFALKLLYKRPFLSKKTAEELDASIFITEAEMHDFKTLIGNFSNNYSPNFFERNKKDIQFLLRREVGYLSHGSDGRFSIAKTRDTQLYTAIENQRKAVSLVQYQLSHLSREKTE
ncbi:MAG: S41 family peptidase [Deferribacteres bacterium]|nr:S41 family peptidase [candidate division KSB1 bacterium]MCB9501529.1 S41 family peptidase [Deferribacteres bacterium]